MVPASDYINNICVEDMQVVCVILKLRGTQELGQYIQDDPWQ